MKGRRPALIILVLLVALIGQYINILYQRLHDIERDNVSLKDQNAKLQQDYQSQIIVLVHQIMN